ncbi:DUF4394 domain-containing protein [Streptomyces sp. NPDC004266]|uniref:DUF4394 domain-containing protein n=1 Tax=Streptomyces sp. NPDC004266 TaxID=3364693 RepID=UPI003691145F
MLRRARGIRWKYRSPGLSGDTELVGIDLRVQNEKLYGVGDKGGVSILNTTDAKAGKVSQPAVAPAGTAFGVDFGPAAPLTTTAECGDDAGPAPLLRGRGTGPAAVAAAGERCYFGMRTVSTM